MKNYLLALLFCLSFQLLAQDHHPRCIYDEWFTELMKSPAHREMYEASEIALAQASTKYIQTDDYIIPVVVHILYRNDEENISEEQIYRQIEIINEDYNSSNLDVSQTPEEFQSLIGDIGIEFCLASVDPEGFATNGITRTYVDTNEINYFTSTSDHIKHPEYGGKAAWNTDDYLNIWVGPITPGVLGYSLPPINSIEPEEEGLVVGTNFFGETNHDQYGGGRTAVHEIGHYFNLKHPWGIGGCSSDDYVSDTPVSESAYYGSPEYPQISCETSDMFMNFMDYVDDSVMVMFSAGQGVRMANALTIFRSELLESNGCGTPLLIAQPTVIHTSDEISADGAIHLNISGVAPFTVEWSTGALEDSIVDLAQGVYSVSIVDAAEQSLELSFEISYYGLIIDSDNFESYSSDSLISEQSAALWSAWCTESAFASIDLVNPMEGLQYMEINGADGSTELIHTLDNQSENAYDLSFGLYVPAGRASKYRVFHDATCIGSMEAYSVEFGSDGNGFVRVAGQNIEFDFPQNQWFLLNQLIDIDRDLVELQINSEPKADWTFSWTAEDENGYPKLAGLLFDSQADSSVMVHYYVDDFQMVLAANSDLDIQEPYMISDVNLYPNPAKNQIVLSTAKQEDCTIQIYNFQGQRVHSERWMASSEYIIDIKGLSSGIYFVNIQTATESQNLKFIKLD